MHVLCWHIYCEATIPLLLRERAVGGVYVLGEHRGDIVALTTRRGGGRGHYDEASTGSELDS